MPSDEQLRTDLEMSLLDIQRWVDLCIAQNRAPMFLVRSRLAAAKAIRRTVVRDLGYAYGEQEVFRT